MDIKKNSMIRLSTYFEIAILSCLIVYQCHCATTTTPGSTSRPTYVPKPPGTVVAILAEVATPTTMTTGSTPPPTAEPNLALTPLATPIPGTVVGQTPTSQVQTRYAVLLQGLGTASNARAALERQLQQYRTTFEALKKAEQHDRGMFIP